MVQDIIPENPLDGRLLTIWNTVNGWGWAKFVPLSEFFEKFNVPDMARIEDRVKNNFIYFRTNYIALYALILLISAFTAPVFAVVNFCLIFLWFIPFICVPTPFTIGNYRVSPSCIVASLAACFHFDICIIVVTGLTLILFRRYILHFIGINIVFLLCIIFLIFVIVVMGLHCIFRNSSLMSRLHIGLNEKNKLKKLYD